MTQVQTFARAEDVGQARGHVLGGGTLLMRQVNYAPQEVDLLLRVTDPHLREIHSGGGRISLGAGVTMTQILSHPELGALAAAARSIGGPALRNMATVGGNLFAASPYGDLTTALLALEAQVVWAGGRSEDLEGFLRRRDQASGIVTAVSIPQVQASELRYSKMSRTKPKGVSVMTIAAWIKGGSRVEEARIAFGAMGPTPLRARAAEAALRGASLDAQGVAQACAVCVQDLAPASDALASDWYRRQVAPVQLRRLLVGA